MTVWDENKKGDMRSVSQRRYSSLNMPSSNPLLIMKEYAVEDKQDKINWRDNISVKPVLPIS